MEKDIQIHRGRGLVDLIAGVTPTYVDWTVDPTDGADITDNDVSTSCTTGNNVIAGGYVMCFFEWDLGAMYQVLVSVLGIAIATAGTPRLRAYFYDGTDWNRVYNDLTNAAYPGGTVAGSHCSKVRLGCTSSVAATVTPDVTDFHVWRL